MQTNLMMQSVEEFWWRNFVEEVKKRKEMEEKIKLKDEQAGRFRQMYHFYEERTFLLEDMLRRSVAGEGCSTAVAAVPEEQVESCFVDLNRVPRKDMACKNCQSRPATMLWLPCRHLCVCLICERRVKICPICGVQKTESFMINLPSTWERRRCYTFIIDRQGVAWPGPFEQARNFGPVLSWILYSFRYGHMVIRLHMKHDTSLHQWMINIYDWIIMISNGTQNVSDPIYICRWNMGIMLLEIRCYWSVIS